MKDPLGVGGGSSALHWHYLRSCGRPALQGQWVQLQIPPSGEVLASRLHLVVLCNPSHSVINSASR